MKKGKCIITAIAILAVTATIAFLAVNDSTPEIRNIILISIDTCRADYLSCYGYPQETTPNIDAFAGNATLFKNVVSPVPITLPAHSSMLTGTIPPFHGVHNNILFKLAPSNQTLPEILKLNGFNTSAIVSAFVLDKQFGLAQGFDTYHDTFKKIQYNPFGNERKGDETTQVALDWLEKNKDNRSFLMLHYFDPHIDYAPPEPFASKFADNLYAGEIAFTDHCIGRFIRKLKELQMYDSTLLIIAGDHGEMLGEHGEEEQSYFIYESAIKVPLIVKLPGQKKAATVTQPVGLVDIVPTLCSILNIDIPAQVQGEDITALLQGGASDTYERFLYSESLTPTRLGAGPLMSISTGRWKYIQAKRPELYDITTDPQEQKNLIERESQRAHIIEDKLRDKLREKLEQSVRKDPDSRLALDAESIRRLESLGYVAGKVEGDLTFDKSKDDPKDLIHVFVQFQKAKTLKEKKEFDKAKKILNDLIPQRPDFHEIYSLLGIIAIYQNDHEQAVINFKKQVELRPDAPKAFTNLAGALYKKGEYERAVEYALKATKLDSNDLNALYSLASALEKEGDFDRAVSTFLKVLQLSPDNAKICNSLAEIFIVQEKFDQAIVYYRRSIKIDPDQLVILNNLARLQAIKPLLPSRNLDEAIMFARRLCELTNFKHPNALDTLAITYAAAGKFPQAIETTRKAIDIATSANKTELAQEIAARLKLYEQSIPYTHPPSQ
jgi:arylsulfatase A-like enzyme/cytochrome c-type biogenesis protein CcmH/NrfG